MNIKPATPLPQGVPPDSNIYIGNLCTTPRTIAIWRERAEAYPELVAALRAFTEPNAQGTNIPYTNARALLAKLGEV